MRQIPGQSKVLAGSGDDQKEELAITKSHCSGPYLLFLQILPDSPQTWCMPKAAINDSSLPRSGLSRDLPLLPTRSGPSSLFLLCANHLWPQLYFPSFSQRLKSQPWLPGCHSPCAAMLTNTGQSLQLARTLRNAVLTSKGKPMFHWIWIQKDTTPWKVSGEVVGRKKRKNILISGLWLMLKDGPLLL